ncbi:hypothetical protein GW17_00051353 [Ensete ventricosum]|nr:hypothetical protein GW17_00051353 [Ensete ventricosum]
MPGILTLYCCKQQLAHPTSTSRGSGSWQTASHDPSYRCCFQISEPSFASSAEAASHGSQSVSPFLPLVTDPSLPLCCFVGNHGFCAIGLYRSLLLLPKLQCTDRPEGAFLASSNFTATHLRSALNQQSSALSFSSYFFASPSWLPVCAGFDQFPDDNLKTVAARDSLRLLSAKPASFSLYLLVGGDSMSGHRAYARAMVEKPPHQEKGPKITSEAREAEYPDHDSALVILIRIANARGQDSDSGHWELRRRAIPRVLLEAQLD